MNRKETIDALHSIAQELAREFGFTELISSDPEFGIWDMLYDKPLSEVLREQFGEMTEFKLHDGKLDEKGSPENYIGFRYRFSSPCLAIHRRINGEQVMGEIEISDYRRINGEFSHTDDYRFAEANIWKPDGINYFKMLYDMWNSKVEETEGCKPPTGYYGPCCGICDAYDPLSDAKGYCIKYGGDARYDCLGPECLHIYGEYVRYVLVNRSCTKYVFFTDVEIEPTLTDCVKCVNAVYRKAFTEEDVLEIREEDENGSKGETFYHAIK